MMHIIISVIVAYLLAGISQVTRDLGGRAMDRPAWTVRPTLQTIIAIVLTWPLRAFLLVPPHGHPARGRTIAFGLLNAVSQMVLIIGFVWCCIWAASAISDSSILIIAASAVFIVLGSMFVLPLITVALIPLMLVLAWPVNLLFPIPKHLPVNSPANNHAKLEKRLDDDKRIVFPDRTSPESTQHVASDQAVLAELNDIFQDGENDSDFMEFLTTETLDMSDIMAFLSSVGKSDNVVVRHQLLADMIHPEQHALVVFNGYAAVQESLFGVLNNFPKAEPKSSFQLATEIGTLYMIERSIYHEDRLVGLGGLLLTSIGLASAAFQKRPHEMYELFSHTYAYRHWLQYKFWRDGISLEDNHAVMISLINMGIENAPDLGDMYSQAYSRYIELCDPFHMYLEEYDDLVEPYID